MADVDEDVIPRNGPALEDNDLSDETQDFRFLSILSAADAKVPKRGEKDFEPHETALQNNTLAASRQAMHNALAFQRVHQPKSHIVATYHPATNMAYAQNPRGPLFARMGRVLSAREDPFGDDGARGQRLWLLPEEALYLIERGTIDVRWPAEDGESEGLPMSLQGAYAMFIGDDSSHSGALTFERYSVYSGLKRIGFTVLRADSWNGPGNALDHSHYPPVVRSTWQAGFGEMWRALFSSSSAHKSTTTVQGPVVSHGVYRSYADIYRKLALINFYDPTKQSLSADSAPPFSAPNFRITYNIWKPGSTTYRKSQPGTPDFRIAVINARETRVPTLDQLSALFETVPYDKPKSDAHFAVKLKHGHKSLILAVVDQGVVSYLRLSDAAFGCEKLFDRPMKLPGGKRGQARRGK